MRIAILGGTFDPIHNGHLAAARLVAAALETDEVLFIPAFSPPHKQDVRMTSAFHRFAMVALATTPYDGFRVSAVEVDTLGPRYSVETLGQIRRSHPEASFVFITGTDMFQEIEEWKDYRHLFELTRFAVVQRPGYPMRDDIAPFQTVLGSSKAGWSDAEADEKNPGTPRVYYFPGLDESISSTRIRDEANRGGSLGEWIPAAVETYIARNELYQ